MVKLLCLAMTGFLLAGCSTVRAERKRSIAVLNEYEKNPNDKLLIHVDSARDADLRNIECLLLIRTTTDDSEINLDSFENTLPFAKILDLAPQLARLRRPSSGDQSTEETPGQLLEDSIRITVGLSCRSQLEYKEFKRIDGIKGRILFEGKEISTISPGLPYSLLTIH